MVFLTTSARFRYGTDLAQVTSNAYCVNNTSASDYGKCYNVSTYAEKKAVFVQTDTTTWPIDPSTGRDSFPCAADGTCIRYTSRVGTRYFDTVFSYSGKQAILQFFRSRSHTPFAGYVGNINYLRLVPVPGYYDGDAVYPPLLLPAVKYGTSSWPIYDPVSNFEAYLNPYSIASGYVNVIRWNGNRFVNTLYIMAYEGNSNNIWYAFDVWMIWAYESSPLAIIPLNYDKDYAPYQELRNAFGYAYTGVDQPGWNADDIIRVLRELFPNRAWAVFDDRQYVLYLYNLTPDYVPDWLIEKLTPTAMKVIQPPADAAVAKAWLDLLNERNQIPPQPKLP